MYSGGFEVSRGVVATGLELCSLWGLVRFGCVYRSAGKRCATQNLPTRLGLMSSIRHATTQ